MGFPIKYWALIILVIQNSSLVMLMRYSLTVSIDQKEPLEKLDPNAPKTYISSTAVVIMEALKILASTGILLYMSLDQYKRRSYSFVEFTGKFFDAIKIEVFDPNRYWIKMIVPSGIYALQNNLLYVALKNLEATTFQITYQLKILTTALFSVLMLGKYLSAYKWSALVLLMFGVAMVQMQSIKKSSDDDAAAAETLEIEENSGNPVLGLFTVILACFLSGFAGVYFEKILKSGNGADSKKQPTSLDSPSTSIIQFGQSGSLWVRNIQLGLFGFGFSLMAALANDWSKISNYGFFYGYNTLTWMVILNQAVGGLIVAVVVKYADNILKGFATSVSILVSGVASFVFLGFRPSSLFLAGGSLVMLAVYMYGKPDAKIPQVVYKAR